MGSQHTTNYDLEKFDGDEVPDNVKFNANSDKIDAGLKSRSTSGAGAPTSTTGFHADDRYYDTTNKKEYRFNGSAWEMMESGKEYSAGDSITIDTDNKISVDAAKKAAWDAKTKVEWTQVQTTGTEIAKIKIDGGTEVSVKAPTSGGATYTAGNGIDISADNKISAKPKTNGGVIVDADGISVDKDNLLPPKVANLFLHVNADGTTVEWAAAGSGSANWGSIGGTLSNQTDLNTALEGTFNSAEQKVTGGKVKMPDTTGGNVGNFLKITSFTPATGAYATEWAEVSEGGSAIASVDLTSKLTIAEMLAGKQLSDATITNAISAYTVDGKVVVLHNEGTDPNTHLPVKLDLYLKAIMKLDVGGANTADGYMFSADMIKALDIGTLALTTSNYSFLIVKIPGGTPFDKWYPVKISDSVKEEIKTAFIENPSVAGTTDQILSIGSDGKPVWRNAPEGKTYSGEGFVQVDNSTSPGKIKLNNKVTAIGTELLGECPAGDTFVHIQLKQVKADGSERTQSSVLQEYGHGSTENAGVLTKPIMDSLEKVANKVTVVDGTATDTQYPSAKAVKTVADSKQDNLVSATNIKTIEGRSIVENPTVDMKLFTNVVESGKTDFAPTSDAVFTTIGLLGGRYVGSVPTYADLPDPTTMNDKDNIIVIADENKGASAPYPTTRYVIVDESGTKTWKFMFYINNTTFTQAQIDAIDSGINLTKVSIYDAYATSKQDKLPGGSPYQVLTIAADGTTLKFNDVPMDVDSSVSTTSRNAVQNKAITTYVDETFFKKAHVIDESSTEPVTSEKVFNALVVNNKLATVNTSLATKEDKANKITDSSVTPLNNDQYFNAIVTKGKFDAVSSRIATVETAVSGKESTDNKVTSVTAASTNTEYPSAKAVYDLVGDADFQPTLVTGTNIKTVNGKDLLDLTTETDVQIIDDTTTGNYDLTYSQATIDAKLVSVSGRMRGIFATKAALDAATPTLAPQNNDNVYVQADETQENKTTKYVWVEKTAPEVSQWELLSEAGSYTPEEMAVLQSGINATKVQTYDEYPNTMQSRIRYGTAAPSGGMEGDIYVQVGVAATRQMLFDLAHPIGETYVQYQNGVDPNTLYNNAASGITCTWEDITASVDRRFAQFMNGSDVGEMIEASLPEHTHSASAANAGGHNHGGYTSDVGNHNHGNTGGAGGHSHGVGSYYTTGRVGSCRHMSGFGQLNASGAFYQEENGTSMCVSSHEEGGNYTIVMHAYDGHGFGGSSGSVNDHAHSTGDAGGHKHSIGSGGDHSHTISVGGVNSEGHIYTGTTVQPAAFTVKLWVRTA